MLDISTASSGTVEAPTDYTGGGGFLLDQNVHIATVVQCYGIKKPSGSMCLHFEFKTAAGKRLKEDCYFLSSKGKVDYPVKGGDGKPTGSTRHLPGFVTCANIVATAFPDSYKTFIADETKGATLVDRYAMFFQEALQSMSPGIAPVYSPAVRKEVDTEVDFIMESIIGKAVKIAVNKNLVNKQKKDANGNYVPVAESREENEIANSFSSDEFSAAEMLAGETKPTKMEAWMKANKGKTNDKREIKTDPEASAVESVSATPDTSLFG